MRRDIIKTINSSTLTQQIIDRVKKAILTKELQPGDQLPSESELAKILGVNVSNVREAIRYLMAMGILEFRYSEGIFVSHGFSNAMFEPIIYGIILSQDSSLDTLKEMRKYTEIAILHLAIVKALKKDVNQISANLTILKSELGKKNNLDNIVAADDKFYSAAFEASRNFLLINIAKTARAYTAENRKTIFKKLVRYKDVKTITQNHFAILRAFKNKDSKNLAEIITNDPLYD